MTNVCNILFLIETRCERSELSTHTHTHTHTHTRNRAFQAFLPTFVIYKSFDFRRNRATFFVSKSKEFLRVNLYYV